jgi:hypothetical protein
MEIILHQAKGMHQPVGPQTSFGEGLDEVMPIHVVEEDVIAPVATAHDMVHGDGILDSHFARHGAKGLAQPNPQVKPESRIYGLTPLMRLLRRGLPEALARVRRQACHARGRQGPRVLPARRGSPDLVIDQTHYSNPIHLKKRT